MRLVVFCLCIIATGCASHESTYQLPFRFTGDAHVDSRFVSVSERLTCEGKVATYEATKIPLPGEVEGIEPELVVEFLSSGEIVRRWWIPLDTFVLAVVGERIYISHGKGQVLSLRESGEIELADLVHQKMGTSNCPITLMPETSDFTNLRCQIHHESSGDPGCRGDLVAGVPTDGTRRPCEFLAIPLIQRHFHRAIVFRQSVATTG